MTPGNVIAGSMAAGAGIGGVAGMAIGLSHTAKAIRAASGLIGAAGAAAGAFDMTVAGAVTVGATATVAGVIIVGGIVIMNKSSPNTCPPEQCQVCP